MKYWWVPSSNQTWFAGKSPSSMIFPAKILPFTVDFPIAMVDFQKAFIPNMDQSPATLWTSPNYNHVSKNCGAHLYSLESRQPKSS